MPSHIVPTLVFLHGNAGTLCHRLPNVEKLLQELPVNVFLLSYRGYGESTGSPSETGLLLDAKAAVKYLQQLPDVCKERLVLFGRSLGAAVALGAATEFPDLNVGGLIMENGFTNIPDMVTILFPFASPFTNFVLDKYDNLDRIQRLDMPLLLMVGLMDELVPPDHTQRLFDAAEHLPHRRMVRFNKGSHNDMWTIKSYYSHLLTFLRGNGLLPTPQEVFEARLQSPPAGTVVAPPENAQHTLSIEDGFQVEVMDFTQSSPVSLTSSFSASPAASSSSSPESSFVSSSSSPETSFASSSSSSADDSPQQQQDVDHVLPPPGVVVRRRKVPLL